MCLDLQLVGSSHIDSHSRICWAMVAGGCSKKAPARWRDRSLSLPIPPDVSPDRQLPWQSCVRGAEESRPSLGTAPVANRLSKIGSQRHLVQRFRMCLLKLKKAATACKLLNCSSGCKARARHQPRAGSEPAQLPQAGPAAALTPHSAAGHMQYHAALE